MLIYAYTLYIYTYTHRYTYKKHRYSTYLQHKTNTNLETFRNPKGEKTQMRLQKTKKTPNSTSHLRPPHSLRNPPLKK